MDPINRPAEKLLEAVDDLASTENVRQPGSDGKDLEAGLIVTDRYKILRFIGRGAMGTVYECEQVFLKKKCALKVLNATVSEQATRRFQKEAQAISKLEHPNIIKALDGGVLDNGQPFLAMELVSGKTLASILKESGRLKLEEVLDLFIPISLALHYAHIEGIVHRDLKPSNIVIVYSEDPNEKPIAKIVDFGIARLEDEAQTLTKTGEIFGTPLYMSPEQCAGTRVDHRSDIYSLGCVIFEALTGATPFRGANALETMMQHNTLAVPSMKEASMGLSFSPEAEQVVGKLLEKDPENRFQNCGEVAQALLALKQGDSSALQSLNPSPRIIPKMQFSLQNLMTTLVFVIAIAVSFWAGFMTSQQLDATREPVKIVDNAAAHADLPPMTEKVPEEMRRLTSKISNGTRTFTVGGPVGRLSYWDHGRYHLIPFNKEVSVPQSANLVLLADAPLIGHGANLLHQFKRGDLKGVNVTFEVYFNDEDEELVKSLSRMDLINLVILRHGALSRAAFTELGMMPGLRWLALSHITGNGTDMAAMRNLSKLRVVTASELKNPTPALQKLSNSNNLHRLSLTHMHLTAQDIGLISQMRFLRYLDLNENSYDNKSEYKAILKQLANLEKLEGLSIDAALVNEIPFDKMKNLKTVVLQRKSELSVHQKRGLAALRQEVLYGIEGGRRAETWFDWGYLDPAEENVWEQ